MADRLKFWEAKVPVEAGGLLPSYEAACDLYRGDPDAIRRVGMGFLTRTGFIAVGLYLAGERDPARLAKYSIAASAAVETFVIGWVWMNSSEEWRAERL